MKVIRSLLLAALLVPALPAAAADDEAPAFGHMLSLMQVFVRLAAQSNDPVAGMKAMDDVLAGRNMDANLAAAGLFSEMTAGMPAEHRAKVASIAGEVLGIARRDLGQQGRAPRQAVSTDASLQARKDLTAMGLRYYDSKDYLDAVKRDDALAVEALGLVTEWALRDFGIVRVQLVTHLDNERSQRVAERCGFRREGVLRAWEPVKDEQPDVVMWSRLVNDPAPNPDRA
jgi:hypothetical protein